ncbi:MAG: GNAT family N-acetyltransferase [Mucilaginibacter sp.]|jgi:hypothetical protein|uniref:GNAT family N-acetyltransferase n=1 Tax=Mucilaginibacter sp. TaxID=1882438 RepID=UPI0035676860
MNFENFTIRDRERWDNYVSRSLTYETFHSWQYHNLNCEGEPILFVHQRDFYFIALPVIKRPVENSSFFDMTSVYGYSGPISDVDISNIPDYAIADFIDSFEGFMAREKSVCIFSRLHPFGGQRRLLNAFGGLKNNGTTLYIDLRQPIDKQRDGYDKRLFRQIKKLRTLGYELRECSCAESIKAFADMYHENMNRLKASSRYYFNEQYFASLLSMEGYDNKLLLLYDGTKLICGAIVLMSQHIIRNHLSATSADYLKESPSKLITDEISELGRRAGKAIFHLGGGVNGKQDSLFDFKKRFSSLQVNDEIWCYINDKGRYDQLALQAASADCTSCYFPIYRQPKAQTTISFASAEQTGK